MALVASDTAAGAMVRRLVPVIVLLPSALGWMTLGGERGDLSPSRFGVALRVIANIAGLGAMTWLIATSLKRSEQNGRLIHAELAERERDLAITLDSIGDAVIATDELGRVVRMNPVAEALTGWTLAEARGMPLAEVFQIQDEETGQPAQSPVDRVLREGRIVGLANHTVLVSRDGTSRPIADSGAPIRLPSGAVRGVVLVFRDMTEKAAADEALQRSGRRLQLLADSARQFSVATTDLGGLLDLVARRLSQVIGEACMIRLLTPDRQWFELASGSTYHPDPELLAGIREVLATRRQRVGEGIAGRVAATGEPTLMPVITPEQLAAETPATYLPIAQRMRIASVLTVPLVSNDRVIGVISMTRSDPANPYTVDDMHLAQDLADRAALAIANAALLVDLEQRVSQRTAALERANRELEAFSYSVSHDLRAPLRAINGFSQALIDECGERLDQTGQHYLERVLQGTVRMAGLIDDLLRLSQIGRGEIRPGPIDLSGLAHSVIEELRKREPSRAVDVAIDDGVEGLGDSSLVTIVLENLLGNAWKFTTRRSPAQIAFGSRPGDPASSTVFFVRDNGTGFDMTRAGKLFAPFQRLHSASEFDGTGIGLATVSRIISRHGGRVWAEAAVDQGATFFFTLSDAGR